MGKANPLTPLGIWLVTICFTSRVIVFYCEPFDYLRIQGNLIVLATNFNYYEKVVQVITSYEGNTILRFRLKLSKSQNLVIIAIGDYLKVILISVCS